MILAIQKEEKVTGSKESGHPALFLVGVGKGGAAEVEPNKMTAKSMDLFIQTHHYRLHVSTLYSDPVTLPLFLCL
jgi:hypothetical protein